MWRELIKDGAGDFADEMMAVEVHRFGQIGTVSPSLDFNEQTPPTFRFVHGPGTYTHVSLITASAATADRSSARYPNHS